MMIQVGAKYRFHFAGPTPLDGTPYLHALAAHSGQVVTIEKKVAGVINEAYLVRATDGWKCAAFPEELEPVG